MSADTILISWTVDFRKICYSLICILVGLYRGSRRVSTTFNLPTIATLPSRWVNLPSSNECFLQKCISDVMSPCGSSMHNLFTGILELWICRIWYCSRINPAWKLEYQQSLYSYDDLKDTIIIYNYFAGKL